MSRDSQRFRKIYSYHNVQPKITSLEIIVDETLDFKHSVRVATTSGSPVTFSGATPTTIDGITLANEDRVLLKDQASGSQNGIYYYEVSSDGGSYSFVRASDARQGTLDSGAFTYVEEGSIGEKTSWVLTTKNPITIDVTALTWELFGATSGSVASIFTTQGSKARTTYNTSFDSDNRYVDSIGSDVAFFVSGSSTHKAVFGGDIVGSGSLVVNGSVRSTSLTGSLTNIADGTSYLVAGSGITIFTGSNGAVTITNNGAVGDITAVTAGTGLSGGGTSGGVTLNIDNAIVATVSGSTFTGVTKHNAGLSGSLTKLTDGTSYLIAGGNVTVVTGSAGSVTFATINSGTIHGVTAGTGLTGGGTSGTVSLNLSNTGSAGTYGSATQVPVFSTDAQGRVASATNTSIQIAESQVTSLTTDLGNRALTSTTISAGTGLSGGGDLSASRTLSIDNSVVATISGSTFTGAVKFNAGLSGSLTQSGATAGSVFFAGTGGVLSQNNANLFWDNTNARLGIGKTSPTKKLHVSGSSSDVFEIDNNNGNWNRIYLYKPERTWAIGQDDGQSFVIADESAGAYRVFIDNAGNVGIGSSTSPGARLQVSGSSTGTTTTLLAKHGVAVGSNLPVFDVQNSAGTSLLFVSGSGNVGIGITNPSEKLHVNSGNIKVDTSGYGVRLPSSPSNADSQTLDSYNESTISARFYGATGGGVTMATGKDTLHVTRIGRLVTITGFLKADAGTKPSISGRLAIDTSVSTSPPLPAASTGAAAWIDLFQNTMENPVQAYIDASDGWIYIDRLVNGSKADLASYIEANSEIRISVTYVAA